MKFTTINKILFLLGSLASVASAEDCTKYVDELATFCRYNKNTGVNQLRKIRFLTDKKTIKKECDIFKDIPNTDVEECEEEEEENKNIKMIDFFPEKTDNYNIFNVKSLNKDGSECEDCTKWILNKDTIDIFPERSESKKPFTSILEMEIQTFDNPEKKDKKSYLLINFAYSNERSNNGLRILVNGAPKLDLTKSSVESDKTIGYKLKLKQNKSYLVQIEYTYEEASGDLMIKRQAINDDADDTPSDKSFAQIKLLYLKRGDFLKYTGTVKGEPDGDEDDDDDNGDENGDNGNNDDNSKEDNPADEVLGDDEDKDSDKNNNTDNTGDNNKENNGSTDDNNIDNDNNLDAGDGDAGDDDAGDGDAGDGDAGNGDAGDGDAGDDNTGDDNGNVGNGELYDDDNNIDEKPSDSIPSEEKTDNVDNGDNNDDPMDYPVEDNIGDGNNDGNNDDNNDDNNDGINDGDNDGNNDDNNNGDNYGNNDDNNSGNDYGNNDDNNDGQNNENKEDNVEAEEQSGSSTGGKVLILGGLGVIASVFYCRHSASSKAKRQYAYHEDNLELDDLEKGIIDIEKELEYDDEESNINGNNVNVGSTSYKKSNNGGDGDEDGLFEEMSDDDDGYETYGFTKF